MVHIPTPKTNSHFEHFCTQVFNPLNGELWRKVKAAAIDGDYVDGIKKMDDIRWLCREEDVNQKNKTLETLKSEVREKFGLS